MADKQRITSFGILLLPVLGIVLLMYLNFTTVVVSGDSMEPTFTSSERVLVSKAYWLVGPIKKKDVVVLRTDDGTTMIKRVLGMPGDTIDFFNVPDDWRLDQGAYQVPQDSVYVVGDNREVSEDSRRFGPVKLSNVIGKVVTPK
jgi:signal peptidase I